ncbi:indolepyruvate ferredoxin oxidoreductase family protein [Streptomyces sp. SID12501]|uniref:Indolepyruvate ferredoxin oxidoreductase family protein n=1 Tax=Streptomyces sp. SID12501 TaxID=2706042 RepID=A0A6B3BI99_9ACTN|nr:indolepyruvate ferredoxin oxidoreductase family protein [Streptomyces sp. SID12501]NEC85064.1 indolepyruvate ferredoxin oxidoreductase family protein [Streptomyces sp. SID12501]
MSTLTHGHASDPASPRQGPPRPTRREVTLTDRYEKRDGVAYMSGLQALVRLPLEQRRVDRANGLDTRTLVSGYEGSPLAGYDLELHRRAALLDEHGVVFRPGVNEELGATAVLGSQLVSVVGEATCDGVVGIWYGKAPGLDRATDAFRHGNLGGAAPTGGVLALVGDDSVAKSSTVPSSSEMAMAEIGMTVLSPCDAQDILELGLHGVALSRFCGLWTGLKLATNVVDGGMTVDLHALHVEPVVPDNIVGGRPYVHEVSADFLQPTLAGLERSLMDTRPELARRYARANGLNRIVGDPAAAIGFVAHGATYLDTLRALRRLGIDVHRPGSGVRVLKLGMISPLEPHVVQEFADGLDEIVVVEEKRAFVELALKDLLYGRPGAPAVFGKRGPDGGHLLRADADLPPEVIAEAVAARLETRLKGFFAPRSSQPDARARRMLPLLARQPYFCSGCPHNRSTRVPDGSLVGGGIGCSGLIVRMDEDRTGDVIGLCQMGGEGVAWVGLAPFVQEDHIFQNLGDGTYHHSGSLAVRAAVAAGVNITYKLLYNSAVAMTGGQQPVGGLSVLDMVRELLIEGVGRVVITTEAPEGYRRVRLPAGVEVRHRDRLIETQEELSRVEGVSVLIHDQECATELRRKRKRQQVADPATRVFVNERVCEGCGDCGAKSNCLSVQPVETEFGRKTQIHQSSCNKDYSCVDGDCPSFVVVQPGEGGGRRSPEPLAADVFPAPHVQAPVEGFGLRMTGIGGTGVVTTAQVLATAAVIDGHHVRGLDQLGMAQKGGAVVSDLLLSESGERGPNKVGAGECSLYLGCDLLVAAADNNLAITSPDRTIAVVSTSEVPTGAMVTHVEVTFPTADRTLDVIARRTRDLVCVDAREICGRLFGDDQYANTFLVGAATQAGALPIAPESIEKALALNGTAVERNIQAFRRGRQAVADPEALNRAVAAPEATSSSPSAAAAAIAGRIGAGTDTALGALVARRVHELIGYQNESYARDYAQVVRKVRAREELVLGAAGEITEGVATFLFKLMAYKDEYEVARLSLAPELGEVITDRFGAGATWAYKFHPPVLKAWGMKNKMTLGRWAKPALVTLRRMRALRGTKLDPFGMARVRRVERALIAEYVAGVDHALARLTPATRDVVLELVNLPDLVRGYEEIKLANVELYRSRLTTLMASLDAQP